MVSIQYPHETPTYEKRFSGTFLVPKVVRCPSDYFLKAYARTIVSGAGFGQG